MSRLDDAPSAASVTLLLLLLLLLLPLLRLFVSLLLQRRQRQLILITYQCSTNDDGFHDCCYCDHLQYTTAAGSTVSPGRFALELESQLTQAAALFFAMCLYVLTQSNPILESKN